MALFYARCAEICSIAWYNRIYSEDQANAKLDQRNLGVTDDGRTLLIEMNEELASVPEECRY